MPRWHVWVSTLIEGQGAGTCECNPSWRFWWFSIVRNFGCTLYNFVCTMCNFSTKFCGSHIRCENRYTTSDLNRIFFFDQNLIVNSSRVVVHSDDRSCPLSIIEGKSCRESWRRDERLIFETRNWHVSVQIPLTNQYLIINLLSSSFGNIILSATYRKSNLRDLMLRPCFCRYWPRICG